MSSSHATTPENKSGSGRSSSPTQQWAAMAQCFTSAAATGNGIKLPISSMGHSSPIVSTAVPLGSLLKTFEQVTAELNKAKDSVVTKQPSVQPTPVVATIVPLSASGSATSSVPSSSSSVTSGAPTAAAAAAARLVLPDTVLDKPSKKTSGSGAAATAAKKSVAKASSSLSGGTKTARSSSSSSSTTGTKGGGKRKTATVVNRDSNGKCINHITDAALKGMTQEIAAERKRQALDIQQKCQESAKKSASGRATGSLREKIMSETYKVFYTWLDAFIPDAFKRMCGNHQTTEFVAQGSERNLPFTIPRLMQMGELMIQNLHERVEIPEYSATPIELLTVAKQTKLTLTVKQWCLTYTMMSQYSDAEPKHEVQEALYARFVREIEGGNPNKKPKKSSATKDKDKDSSSNGTGDSGDSGASSDGTDEVKTSAPAGAPADSVKSSPGSSQQDAAASAGAPSAVVPSSSNGKEAKQPAAAAAAAAASVSSDDPSTHFVPFKIGPQHILRKTLDRYNEALKKIIAANEKAAAAQEAAKVAAALAATGGAGAGSGAGAGAEEAAASKKATKSSAASKDKGERKSSATTTTNKPTEAAATGAGARSPAKKQLKRKREEPDVAPLAISSHHRKGRGEQDSGESSDDSDDMVYVPVSASGRTTSHQQRSLSVGNQPRAKRARLR